MQTLELKDDVAIQLQQAAEQAHLSSNELIEQLLNQYKHQEKPATLLTDIINELPEISAFKGDPVEIQRTMRNEWD